VLLFSGLTHSPAPLFQDESDGLSRALHWASSGTTYEGQRFPILIHWTGQFYSFPAYFYSIAAWSKLFGTTVQSLRAFSAFLGGITAFLTYAVARLFGLRRVFAVLAGLLFISSPHTLLNYRIAWDPVTLAPLVLVATLIMESTLRDVQAWEEAGPAEPCPPLGSMAALAAAGICCGLLWWSYTPGRLISLVLFAQFLVRLALIARHGAHRWVSMAISMIFFVAVAIPVLHAIASDPRALLRTQQELNHFTLLGIYSTVKSLLSHLAYGDYLLFWGDPQRRHSTGYGGVIGMAGWMIIGVVLIGLYKRSTSNANQVKSDLLGPPAGLVFIYLVICTFPGAISFPELHSLRNIASIPFWCILASLLLQQLIARTAANLTAKPIMALAILITSVNLFGIGAYQYMVAESSFLARAQQGSGYAEQSKEYFQHHAYMEYRSMSDREIVNASQGLSPLPSTNQSRVIFEYYSRGLDDRYGPIRFLPG
jgi:hypothetical protein